MRIVCQAVAIEVERAISGLGVTRVLDRLARRVLAQHRLARPVDEELGIVDHDRGARVGLELADQPITVVRADRVDAELACNGHQGHLRAAEDDDHPAAGGGDRLTRHG